MMVSYLIAIYGMLLRLSQATNDDIIYEYYESLITCIKPENYDNVDYLIDEWLGFFTDDMQFCEGETESDAVCYDKSGLKVKMVESIDKIHEDYAPDSVQYAYIIEDEYGDEMSTEFELMLSSRTCIITLKESHKFTFEDGKIKEVYSYGMGEEEDCTPTTTKDKEYVVETTKDVDICSLPKVTGDCEGYYIRWYYNGKECEEFTYGGCDGNENNFESLAECELHCDEKTTTKKPETTEHKEYIMEKTTKEPTKKTTWYKDTESPTKSPSVKWTTPSPTYKPTNKPTMWPTYKPTDKPTKAPTYKPTKKPTNKPSQWPTASPTKKPTDKPTYWPTKSPTYKPTEKPTDKPTYSPTKSPTTPKPTGWPTYKPTAKPTYAPTKTPTTPKPTQWPTQKPTTPKPTTTKPTTGKPTIWEKKTDEPTMWKKTTNAPTVWKKETQEPTAWAKTTNKPSLAPTKKDDEY